jgi:hypothetical protein
MRENKGLQKTEFPYFQYLDLQGIQGLASSYSYTPRPEDENYETFQQDLQKFFDNLNQEGRIEINYAIDVVYGQL